MVATTGIAIELQDKTKQGARSITRSLDDIKKSARETATSVDKLDDNFDKLKDELDKTGRSADKAGEEFDKLARSANKVNGTTGGLSKGFGSLKGAIATLGIGVLVSDFIRLSDAGSRIQNRLKLVTQSTQEFKAAQEELFSISQRSRVGFEQTADLYARLARSSSELGLSQEQLSRITETVSQAITISGSSADAASAALLQLGQGIASGTLRGDELNSVLEQTPRLAQAIADGIGVSIGQLRALGAEGKLTSETVIAAIQSQEGTVRSEFGQTATTLDQSFTMLENSLIKLVDRINEATGASGLLAGAIVGLSRVVDQPSGPPALDSVTQRQMDELLLAMAGRPSTRTVAETLQDVGLGSRSTRFSGEDDIQRMQALQSTRQISSALRETAIAIKAEADLVKQAADSAKLARIGELQPIRMGGQIGTPIAPSLKQIKVDETVFGFQDVIDEVDKQIQRETESFIEFGNALGQFSPQLNTAINGFDALIKGDYIGAAISGFMLLTETLGPSAEQVAEFRQQMQELFAALDQGNESAQRIIEDLFFENVSDRQQEILTQFEQAFGFFERGGYGNITNSAEAVRELFDYIARIDVRGASALTEEAFLNLFGQNYQTLRAALDQAFGTTSTFAEIAELMFDTSDSFDHLRESADSAVTSVNRLSQAEEAATRLRINAQEIALRTQLSREFRRAGSDVFEQRAAYNRFQQAVRQLQYMGRAGAALTGGGGGAGASTTAATTTATGGGAATTGGATTAGLPPINATVAINAAMVTPDQLVRLPSEQDMESYYSAELLPVLSDPVAPILDQFSDNIRANKVRIYPWTLFDVPSSSVWSSYWSRFLLARADTEETGPDSVSAQIVKNASDNKKYISPFTLFDLPTADDWSSYWSSFLLGRADTAEHGPDNIAAQILDNTKTNKKLIRPQDMFIVPTSSIWDTYWSVFLLGQADTDEHGPDNVAAQILDNTQTNRVRINPADMFAIASGDQFRSFWQQGLNSIVVTDEYGPGAAIAYTREHTANRKLEIKPSDLFSIPSGFDFFFLFADLAPNITFGLNSVLNNLSTIPVNVANLIDFDASGISEAINAAVKEAISDRSYDAPQRLGFTSGRA